METHLKVLVSKKFSIDQCKKNSKALFIFGDCRAHEGYGGTAVIRGQRNSIGISTKHKPSNDADAFYTDDEYDENIKFFEKDLERIKAYALEIEADSLCFPFYGIGTGFALLPLKAPRTFFYLCTRLYEEWKFNNIEGAFTIK